MKYEIIYTKTITKVVEIDQHQDIFASVHDHQPEGYSVQDWYHIQDEEHLSHVLAQMKAEKLANQVI